MLEPDLLRAMIRFEPDSGFLYWLHRDDVGPQWNARHAGKRAFTSLSRVGQYYGSLGGRRYYAHRVGWCLHYGFWPPHQIDHINRNPSDNRISNLRLATGTQNQGNRGVRVGNSSGLKGVGFHKATGKWRASIGMNGKAVHLGLFSDRAAAHAAYCAASEDYFGNFSNNGLT